MTCTVAEYGEHVSRCGYRDEDTCEGEDTCPQCGELLPDTGPATRRGHQQLVCPRTAVACSFLSVGCDTRLARAELQRHLETSATHHMRLLADRLTKLQQVQQAERVISRVCSTEEEEECSSLPATATPLTRTEHQAVRMSGSNLHSQARLIRCSLSLYCCQGSYLTTHQGTLPEGD